MIGETSFDVSAIKNGLSVSRPIGDKLAYDRITEHNGVFKRVQIKSINTPSRGGFRCDIVRNRNVKYSKSDVDIFAVYIIPIDKWFIFDNDGRKSAFFKVSNMKYENNWQKLKQ